MSSSKMRIGVVVFPGSNCDHDCYDAVRLLGYEAEFVWHKNHHIEGFDCLILPGGFSYGDYLRAGAIAKLSPVMADVKKFAEGGGLVIGICNGFQILLEAGLLPGAMLWNRDIKFICKETYLRVESTNNPFLNKASVGDVLKIPVAHNEGNYFIDDAGLQDLIKHEQVLLRYCDAQGEISESSNPNGAVFNIAGITNKAKNVFGLMPHPERAVETLLGSVDGRKIFSSLAKRT